jgi:hypothetical protein
MSLLLALVNRETPPQPTVGGYYEGKRTKRTFYEIDGKIYQGTLYDIKKRLEALAEKRAIRAARKASTREKIVEVKAPAVLPEIVFSDVAPLSIGELKTFYVNAYASAYADRLFELRRREEDEEAELLLLF